MRGHLVGEPDMILMMGRQYRCQNKKCAAEIEVKKGSIEGSNPTCCCGTKMKQIYEKPAFRILDKDHELARRFFAKEAR